VRVLLISANRELLPSPVVPLGILGIAGAVRDEHEVRVADLCFEPDPIAAATRAVADFDPEVVGIGIRNLSTNAYDGTESLLAGYRELVQAVRRATSVPIVLGGAGFSLQPKRLLAYLGGDYGVVGEGEVVFRALLRDLARGVEPERIVRAEAVTQGPVPLGRRRLGELDRLPPPARDLVDPRYYEYDGTDNLQTKRGCAFSCTYCDYPDLEGRKVRVRDPDAVADEFVARARVPGVTHAFVVDSVFNVPRSHAIATCDAIAERGAPLPWVCYGSPVAFDEEVVAALKRAGCVGVEIGSDSGNEATLARLRKPFDLAAIVRTRELFREHRILDCHTFVLGALDESVDDVKRTLDFVDRLDPDVAVFMAFTEDREDPALALAQARHREAILELLAREAPPRRGWVVPELSIRFGEKLTRVARKLRFRGPSWLHIAVREGGLFGSA
jgi:radical SAM superfamily enzyme YgiQ (UPF0313 family)